MYCSFMEFPQTLEKMILVLSIHPRKTDSSQSGPLGPQLKNNKNAG